MEQAYERTHVASHKMFGAKSGRAKARWPYRLRRCHGEFGTPDLWHPRAKYPREIGTPKQNTLRKFGTPLCTLWGIWHPVTYT